MDHRKWTLDYPAWQQARQEHDALYEDWKKASLEAERLAKINGDMCDTIAELERELEAAEAEIADWKAGHYRDVVMGSEHAGVHRATLGPEPITDEVIERMAEAAHKDFGNPNWECSPFKPAWRSAIRAALAAVGPQYCPADVAFNSRVPGLEAKIERQASELTKLNHKRQLEAGERLRLERELEAVTAQRNRLKMELPELQRELEAVNAERDALADIENRDLKHHIEVLTPIFQSGGTHANFARVGECLVDAVPRMVQAYEEALAARPQPVKVKVRWDTEKVIAYANNYRGLTENDIEALLDYLAAHAVIDAPAGVPTLEELDTIANDSWEAACVETTDNKKRQHAMLSAIRDAVLAGVREENNKVNELLSDAWQQLEELGVVPNSLADTPASQTVTMIGKPLTTDTFGPTDGCAVREPTPEQVEGLARVLESAYAPELETQWDEVTESIKHRRRNQARAAFAHIQPERPKGLPTRDEMAQIIYRAGWCQSYVWDDNDGGSERKQIYDEAEAILAALASWLRDPVGWELDVTAEEARRAWGREYGHPEGVQAVLDLCRSRIRPVMECKECAKWRSYGTKMEDSARMLAKRIDKTRMSMDAARAALEGE